MPSAINVKLNGQEYVVANRKGHPVFSTEMVDPTQESINTSGLPRLSDVPGVSTLVFPNFIDGFGRDRIDSDSAFEKSEYRRCYYATCDIRWARQQYLPILEADSGGDEEVIRASESYKSNLWALWEDGTSTDLVARKYDGSETDWIAGGNIFTKLAQDATASGVNSTNTNLIVAHTCTGNDRVLIVCVTATDSSTTTPSGVTYADTSMTKIGSDIQGSHGASIWYLVAPATGTNNIVVAFAATMDRLALNSVSFTGADQGTPVRTAATNKSASGAAPSAAATSLANDIVVDCLATHISAVLTPHASQTALPSASTTPLRHGSSKETASGSSTTMSWSMSTSQPYALVAVAVKSRVAVGADIIANKTHLLALGVLGDSQSIKRSTDGATFTDPTTDVTQNLLTDIVTAHEDIDAGLLATVGNEAVAVLWHESNGTITFFSSTNAGDVWADELIDIAAGNGPQGVAVMNGIDNAQKLYVGTREGLYEVDTSPSTWTADLIFPMTPNNDNCRRMAVGQDGALWFAQGVDDDTVPIVYRLFTNNGTREFLLSPNDFSKGDGLPAERLGPIRRMIPAQGMMYVAAGGGKVGRKASIFVHNERGWSSIRAHGTANQPIEWMAASGDDDGVPRLHYAVRTATAVSNTKFLKQPFVNPVTGVGVDRESSGFIDLPYLDAGFPGDSGAWLQVVINAESLSSTNSNEHINVDYGHDDTSSGGLYARTNADLGDFLSGTNSIDFASGAGIESVNMGLRINFARDGGNNAHTPKLKDVRIAVLKEVAIRDRFTFTIDVNATAVKTKRTPENIISDWETARALKTMAQFTYGPVTTARRVKVRRALWNVYLAEGSSTQGSVQGSAQVQRDGFIDVVLEEVV